MNKKIVSIVVSMLLFVTVFSVTGAMNIEKASNLTPNSTSSGRAWSDNFDSYATGSALHGQGGWEAWDDNPATTAYVVDDQARSIPNSCEIAWFGGLSADIVQQFTDINSGEWIITTYLYVPSDMQGQSDFILLNTYNHGGPYSWSLQLAVSATSGLIWDLDNPGDSLPLITDDWVQLRWEVDFEADIQTVYYDGEELLSKSWVDGASGGGAKNLACIDLYADTSPSTSVYWDDFLLDRPEPLSCDANGPYEALVDEEIQFDGTAAGGTPPYEFLWDFGNGDTSTVEDPVYTYSEPGVYTVNLTVTDSDQSTASDETTATIEGVPILDIKPIKGGLFKVSTEIENIGSKEATGVQWSIKLEGGAFIGKETEGGPLTIPEDGSETVTSKLIIGFGPTVITATADIPESSDTIEQDGFVFLIFITVSPSGGI
ncbi:MAG: PKD domain-containing protein [Thermoplasmatales archaeon]|nr:MAG: PKD domain-containing protein [Thermoplasmatales archaeon]